MTNQTQSKSFILHKDSLSVLNKLTDEQAGKLFKSIFAYQVQNILPNDELVSIIFEPFLNQFKRDAENYKKTCEARKIAGSKGGKQKVANASKSKQKVANLADSDNKNKNESKNKSENKNEIKLNENNIYKELSNNLQFVLEEKLQRKLSSRNWDEEIKKLIEKDLSVRPNPIEDVKRAIQTIADNYGKDYFPVIQSGSALRQKFTMIENFVKRNTTIQPTQTYDEFSGYLHMMNKDLGGKNGI